MKKIDRIKKDFFLKLPFGKRLFIFRTFPKEINSKFWLRKDEFKLYQNNPIFIRTEDIVGELKEGIVPFLHIYNPLKKIRKIKLHSSIIEVLEQKRNFRDLTQYTLMKKQLELGLNPYNCKSQIEIEMHLKTLISNLKNMAVSGIEPRYDWNQIYPNNILVSKLPNGKYALEKGGTHRYSLALYIKQNKVPVSVIRHIYHSKKEITDLNNKFEIHDIN